MMRIILTLIPAVAIGLATAQAGAVEPVQLTIRDHRFIPDQVTVPAGERIRVEIANQDPTPAEFESSDLRAEKIIVPGGKITVTVGPLKPGAYKFFDEYHPDTATGTLTAVAKE